MKKSLLSVLLAEFIGTFTLCLVVVLSLSGSFPVSTPVLAGLVLALFVYTIGSISGCHINPGVTIGLWSMKKIQGNLALKYIAAQLLAAMVVLFLTDWMGLNFGIAGPEAVISYLFEFLGMALFTFGIAAIVADPGRVLVSGIVIGGSLLLGITVSVLGGAEGLLNPAVALSLAATDVGYYLAQIVGGVVGVQLFSYLQNKKTLPLA